MPRVARHAPGGIIYHVMNRAHGRLRLFKKNQDFVTFQQVLIAAHRRVPIRILGWCLMPDHWQMLLWPRRDGELTRFMRWLTLTHAQRWKHAHGAVGAGHLYQGRFKSLPVQQDQHLLTLLRHVYRNPLDAKLVKRAQDWRWSSLWTRLHSTDELNRLLLEPRHWPIAPRRNWIDLANTPLTADQEQAAQTAIKRGRPFGTDAWVRRTAAKLNLEHTLRPQGRPLGWRKPKPSRNAKKRK
jgi:putative transposase